MYGSLSKSAPSTPISRNREHAHHTVTVRKQRVSCTRHIALRSNLFNGSSKSQKFRPSRGARHTQPKEIAPKTYPRPVNPPAHSFPSPHTLRGRDERSSGESRMGLGREPIGALKRCAALHRAHLGGQFSCTGKATATSPTGRRRSSQSEQGTDLSSAVCTALDENSAH
jgi:hypothetical protein